MFCGGQDLFSQKQQQHIMSSTSSNKIKKIQNYLFKYSDKIGQGNFSQVYSGIDQKTNDKIAVKVVQASSIKSRILSSLLQNQISILKNLSHPNVIHCYDVLTSVNNCYIITQFCQNGDLEKLLKKNKRFQEKDIVKLVYDVYKGLQYLASLNIIHRDLKIANIFLDKNNNAKIADLGFAVKSSVLFKDMSIGSPIYMSPQGLIRHQYGPKTDVWSFGIFLYQLIHGDTPLSHCKTQEQLRQGVILPPKIKVDASLQLIQVIKLCMNPSQKKRITVFQLYQTAYIRKIISLVEGVNISKELTLTKTLTSTNCGTFSSKNLNGGSGNNFNSNLLSNQKGSSQIQRQSKGFQKTSNNAMSYHYHQNCMSTNAKDQYSSPTNRNRQIMSNHISFSKTPSSGFKNENGQQKQSSLHYNLQSQQSQQSLSISPQKQGNYYNFFNNQNQNHSQNPNSNQNRNQHYQHLQSNPLFNWILSYQEVISLIHYCRLVHKTTKQFQKQFAFLLSSSLTNSNKSMHLEQWLLTLSYQLTRATIDSRCEKIKKVQEVLIQYDKKYQKEHIVLRCQKNIDQILIQCNTLQRIVVNFIKNQKESKSSNYDNQKIKRNEEFLKYLKMLMKESQLLRKYLKNGKYESYSKYSQCQQFLSKRSSILESQKLK